MKLNKPKFWDKEKSFLAYLIWPFSIIILIIIFLKENFVKKVRFKIPIICVGNIYIGGTGKTPTSILIANKLKKHGRRPAIVRKFYKDHLDEYNLIRNYFTDLFVEKKRKTAILKAQNQKFDCIILDDGFQNYEIEKNLSIICFNQKQFIGNGFVIPAGPLRENLNALKRAQIVIINGEKNYDCEKKLYSIKKDLKIFYSHYVPENINKLKNQNLLAFAAIGNPSNFFDLLNKYNLNIKKKIFYPDHYIFSKSEVSDIINDAKNNNYQIITTEKDFFRIKDFDDKEIKYLKVNLKINNEEELINTIKKLYA